jgi:hypothetical protein
MPLLRNKGYGRNVSVLGAGRQLQRIAMAAVRALQIIRTALAVAALASAAHAKPAIQRVAAAAWCSNSRPELVNQALVRNGGGFMVATQHVSRPSAEALAKNASNSHRYQGMRMNPLVCDFLLWT